MASQTDTSTNEFEERQQAIVNLCGEIAKLDPKDNLYFGISKLDKLTSEYRKRSIETRKEKHLKHT